MLIKDLSLELDAKTLSAVRGGNNGNAGTNTIGQVQNMSVPLAIGTGGPANTNVSVTGTQNASIFSFQDAGDHFVAFPFFGPMLAL